MLEEPWCTLSSPYSLVAMKSFEKAKRERHSVPGCEERWQNHLGHRRAAVKESLHLPLKDMDPGLTGSSNSLFWGIFIISVAQSCLPLCDPMDCSLCPWNSPGKNIRVGCQSLLQGIFPTQGSNPGLLHCGQILQHLSHLQGIVRSQFEILIRGNNHIEDSYIIQSLKKNVN